MAGHTLKTLLLWRSCMEREELKNLNIGDFICMRQEIFQVDLKTGEKISTEHVHKMGEILSFTKHHAIIKWNDYPQPRKTPKDFLLSKLMRKATPAEIVLYKENK